MFLFNDDGIFVKLEYCLPKFKSNAIFIDFAEYKNKSYITFNELIDNLNAYALIYGNCAIKQVDIKLKNDSISDCENSSHGYDFKTFVAMLELDESKSDLFVEKCVFELIKPLEFQWFDKPKKKSKYNRKPISGKVRQDVFMRDDYTCQICGANRQRDNVKIEVDHILPISKGGTNNMDNLQTLCQRCNREKHNRTDLLHDKRKLNKIKAKS